MATYTFDKIEYGGNTYVVSDSGALQLTGGQVTGPVIFGDAITVDEATLGDLTVNGNASFTNNIQANTINGVTVGSSPKFTDTNTEVSTLTLVSGSTAGTALSYGEKYTLTAGSKTVSFTMPASDNTNTTYALSGALSSHKFTSTLTAGGSGSGTSTADFTLAAGTGITITDDTTNRKMTIACSVTNTDTKVTQSASTSSTNIPVLLRDNKDASTDAGTADASRFVSTVTVQPSTGNLQATKFNNYTLAAACAKGVDTSLTTSSTSTNLPTSAAVATLVSGSTFKSTTASLTVAGWSSNSQTVTVNGVTASNTVIVSPAPASYGEYSVCSVYCSAQAANSLTFTCSETPSGALTVNILYK